VVLITGASGGIGSAATVEFAARGFDVIATMRDPARGDALAALLRDAGLTATVVALDVADDASTAGAIGSILAERGSIDVVVSNAGIGLDGTTEELSIDEFRSCFETNVFGSIRLLHGLLPQWRARGAGRFIAVSSTAGAVGMPFNDAYCSSKFALEGLLESLAPVVALHGISVSILEPGQVAGEFTSRSGPPSGRRPGGPYAESRSTFQGVQDAGFRASQSPAEIAVQLADIAQEESPALRYQSSEAVRSLVGLSLSDLDGRRVTRATSRWITPPS